MTSSAFTGITVGWNKSEKWYAPRIKDGWGFSTIPNHISLVYIYCFTNQFHFHPQQVRTEPCPGSMHRPVIVLEHHSRPSHLSHSCQARCRWRGGGSWPGSPCPLCPARQSESATGYHGEPWSPTRTRCCWGTSKGIPERTASRWWDRAPLGHSHHLQGNTHVHVQLHVWRSLFKNKSCTQHITIISQHFIILYS